MEGKAKKFIIDIIPLARIPLGRDQFFCYLSDKKLISGTLVIIPLGNRKIDGIVIRTRKDFKRLGGIQLKKIDAVIEENFLDEKQFKLAQFISDYYLSPLGVIMRNFAPERVKKRRKEKKEERTMQTGTKKIILTKEQSFAVDKISSFMLRASRFLLFGPAASGKTEVYIHSIIALKKNNPDLQFLILIPEQTLAPQALERYGAYFGPGEIVLLSSNVSKGRYYSCWKKIKSGEAKIIIGTRMAIFAPFQKLGLVVIDEEQDMSFKQWDMNPRYDARTSAEKLAEIHKCAIVRGSAVPSIETYWRAINKELKLLELPVLNLGEARSMKQETGLTSFEIVDMKKERWQRNYSSISKKLKNEIAYALKNKSQAILFINRQGMSAFTVCSTCKTLLKCPKCERALVYDREGFYKCLHCSYKSGVVPKCSQCGGIAFKNLGIGTQKVAKEISNLFPSAKIIIADSSVSHRRGFQDKIFSDFSSGSADILIGTQMISKGWDLPRIALAGIIDTDNSLALPDFAAGEKVFQNIVQISGRVNRPGFKYPGMVIIQTFQPDNLIIKLAAKLDYRSFWKYETEERKKFKLPPFGKLIRLIFQDYDQDKVCQKSLEVFNKLIKIAGVETTDPHDPLAPKIRGKIRKQIIVKFREKLPEDLKTVLKNLESGWVIDVDPINLI